MDEVRHSTLGSGTCLVLAWTWTSSGRSPVGILGERHGVRLLLLVLRDGCGLLSWHAQFCHRYRFGMVLDTPVVVTGASVGSRNALFDDRYMLCIIQGGLWKNFTIFYMKGWTRLLSSIHVLLFSPLWPAHRRQRQWHVPYWFCWFDAPRAMFPRFLAVCREVHNRCFGCSRVALGNLYIIFFVPPVFSACSTFVARVDFLEPSSTHTCECSRAGGTGVAGSHDSQVPWYRQCTINPRRL